MRWLRTTGLRYWDLMFQTNKQLLVSQADIVVVENPSEQKH